MAVSSISTPTWTTPDAAADVPRDRAVNMAWTYVPNPGSTATAVGHGLEYRAAGTSTWTVPAADVGAVHTPASSHSFASGTITVDGAYEFRVRVKDSAGLFTNYSAIRGFNFKTTPTAPTTVSPATGATITNPTQTVTWTPVGSMTSFQIQLVASGGGVTYDSGEIGGGSGSYTIPTTVNGTGYTIQVRQKASGTSSLWSDWTAVTGITINVLNPQVPTGVSAAPADPTGSGSTTELIVSMTHPAPGSNPAVAVTEVWARILGDTGSGTLVKSSSAGAVAPMFWYGAAANTYQVKVIVRAADGRFSETAWVTASAANVIQGVFLSNAVDPSLNPKSYRFNGDGAALDYAVDKRLVDVEGRTSPVVEFGTRESTVVKVSLDVKTRAEYEGLLALVALRVPILYRDRHGRSIAGLLEVGTVQDTQYGFATDITVTRTA